jgi:hypothetical protein
MTAIQEWLQGKKTYIIMIVGFVFNIGVVAGWWTLDNQVWDLVNMILVFLGVGSIRAGVSTEARKLKADI